MDEKERQIRFEQWPNGTICSKSAIKWNALPFSAKLNRANLLRWIHSGYKDGILFSRFHARHLVPPTIRLHTGGLKRNTSAKFQLCDPAWVRIHLEIAWNPLGIHLEIAWNPLGNRLESTWNSLGNRLESTWKSPGIHLEFTWKFNCNSRWMNLLSCYIIQLSC